MKILQIGKYYSPYRGGMETVLENLTLGLQAKGHGVSVMVSGDEPWRQSRPWPEGGRLIRLPRAGNLNSQPLTYSLVSELRRELFRFRPDVVHLHFPNPLGAAAWLALAGMRQALPPLFIWHHADITRQRIGRMLAAPLQATCLRRARGICVSSDSLFAHSKELTGVRDRTAVIPFGIDPEPWCSVTRTSGGPFLFVGRLVAYKGLTVLLEAVARVPGAELDIVGTGPLTAALAAQVAGLGVGGRVRLRGDVASGDLLALMARATALVLPSIDTSETFGLVQLEAMAAGLPVIATDLPTGVAQVGVPDLTGHLVPPMDVGRLADCLAGMLADAHGTEEMGRRSRERFMALYTREKMVDRLADFYARTPLGAVGGRS